MIRRLLFLAFAFHPAIATAAETFVDQVGDVYELRLKVHTKNQSERSSGSSSSNYILTETVLAIRGDAVELEFDLPKDTPADTRAREWGYPVRVLKAPGEPFELLNEGDLATRIDKWLELGNLSRSACEQWIFTWAAFKIECDPATVLGSLAEFDVRLPDVRDRGSYSHPGTVEPSSLKMTSSSSDGQNFAARLAIDPDFVRRQRAEADVAIAQMAGGPPVTLTEALAAWSDNEVSGEVDVVIAVDAQGLVVRRVAVSDLSVVDERGGEQSSSVTSTLERALVVRGGTPVKPQAIPTSEPRPPFT